MINDGAAPSNGKMMPDKKVKLNLEGLDGNAFNLLGAFARAARRQGWTADEISQVTTEAKKSDYDHLLRTLIQYTDTEEA